MTNRYITADQATLNTDNGDNTFVARDVTMSGGINMSGNGGGDQTVTIYGTLFGSINDYYSASSGNDQIFIGATGSVNTYWWGAIELGGGGHIIVNAGTLSSMSYGSAIYIYGGVGAHQADRDYITNTGTISGISQNPDRGFGDATINVSNTAGVTLSNSGDILSSTGYAVSLGTGADVVTNNGYIQGGVQLSDGNDRFDGRHGQIDGGVFGGQGDDTLFGGQGDDTLVGGDGNDRLNGFTDGDVMIGGTGDDKYYVDDANDVVDENNVTWGGDGNDTVYASIGFDLAGDQVFGTVENLILTGTANIDASGTGMGDYIDGNRGANVLIGLAGDDTMNGGQGADQLYGDDGADNLGGEGGRDTLYGGNGADTLNGGSGGDLMFGGGGNDVFYFDNVDDVANESAAGSGGVDLIKSTVSVDLADSAHVKGQVEKLTLQGSDALSGSGNSLGNVIIGNSGKNVLDGRGGNDTLTGGGGVDKFTFSSKPNGSTNHDTITDFVHGTDKLLLDHSVFTAFTGTGALSAGNFALNAPTDGNDYIIYNTSTGGLYYDADGNGAGASVLFATLDGIPGLTQADFVIV